MQGTFASAGVEPKQVDWLRMHMSPPLHEPVKQSPHHAEQALEAPDGVWQCKCGRSQVRPVPSMHVMWCFAHGLAVQPTRLSERVALCCWVACP